MNRRRPMRGGRGRPGFFFLDTIVGFALVGVLALVLVIAISRANVARQRMDDGAAAVRIAQRVLGDLRAGKPAAPAPDGAQVRVTPADGAAPVPGREWVEVTVNVGGRTASLVGLAPKGGVR